MVEKIKLLEINELMEMLDYDSNELDEAMLSRIFVNSARVLNWKCSKGHSFNEKVSVMYKRKNKCFYCTGRQIWPGENDLKTLYPELAIEFDIEMNNITPDLISPKDTKTYWWKCGNNHPSFPQSVEHRVNRKTVCPYCSGRKVIAGKTDLETLYPEIASEWDYEKNAGVNPDSISAYSYNSYYWICPKGHSYKKKVIKRTKYHSTIDCPKCVKAHSTSFPEQAIFYYAKKCFPDAINRYKDPFENGMELDVYIPMYRLGIEYDGAAFHNNEEQHNRERKKYLKCQELGISLVRIKETQDTWNDTSDEIFYIKKRLKDDELASFLSFLFSKIFAFSKYTFKSNDATESFLNHTYGFPTDFNISRDRAEILEYLIDVEHSFGKEYPELAENWSKEKNGNLTPYMFTSGSNYQAYWKCASCGNTWKSTIASIVSRNAKTCRTCSMKANGKTITNVKTLKYGSLAERCEELLKQWDYEANGDLLPNQIPLNYSKKVAWKCDVCGYRWPSAPNARYRAGIISKCPHCIGRVAMAGVDDFATLYPDAAQYWDFEKNEDIRPSDIKPFSNTKYYFRCINCGKSYLTVPGNIIKGHACSDCGHKKVGAKNAILVGQFDEDGILINSFQGIHQVAREMGVVPNAIFQAVKNGRKSKGYYWRYIELD